MTDTQKELVSLRVSLARIAQRLGVETDDLRVRGKDYNELSILAVFQERGWNRLAEACAEKADQLNGRNT